MRTISVKSGRSSGEIQDAAIELLHGGIDTGDTLAMHRAIWLAKEHKMDVQFELPSGQIVSADLAYRLVFVRGFDIRNAKAREE